MGLVTHHDDNMVGIDRFCLGVAELLDEGEDEGGIALQLGLQVFSAGGNKLLGFHVASLTLVPGIRLCYVVSVGLRYSRVTCCYLLSSLYNAKPFTVSRYF